MVKVYLTAKTLPDFNTFLTFSKEVLGRHVSSLADLKSRQSELQRFALMLSEAIDPDADGSVLDNLGPVLGHISFSFSTVIMDIDYIDVSLLLTCDTLRVPAKHLGYSWLHFSASLKQWREIVIDSLSSNVTNSIALEIVAKIYDHIKLNGFSKLWSDIGIENNNGILIESKK